MFWFSGQSQRLEDLESRIVPELQEDMACIRSDVEKISSQLSKLTVAVIASGILGSPDIVGVVLGRDHPHSVMNGAVEMSHWGNKPVQMEMKKGEWQ